MGERGPAPKPTALRVLHGDKKTRIPQGEPQPAAQPVKPPADLDADALALWHQLAPDLERQGVLTYWDAEVFGIYCQSVVYNHRARSLINQTSVILAGRDSRDMAVKNPAVQIFRDMAELVIRSGSRFGLTPSDRAGLATGQADQLPGEHLLSR